MQFRPDLFFQRDLAQQYGGPLRRFEWDIIDELIVDEGQLSLPGNLGYREIGSHLFMPPLRRPNPNPGRDARLPDGRMLSSMFAAEPAKPSKPRSLTGHLQLTRDGAVTGELWGSRARLGRTADYPEAILSIGEAMREYPHDGSWWSAWLMLPRADGELLLVCRVGGSLISVNGYETVRKAGLGLVRAVGEWMKVGVRGSREIIGIQRNFSGLV